MSLWNDGNLQHFVQRISSYLLCASIASLMLVTPSLAQTDAERIAKLEKDISQIISGMANNSSGDTGLPLHGFLDIGASSRNHEDSCCNLHGYNVGLLDFYLTPQFSDNVKSLVELVFEVDAHGDVVVDFERAQVGYTFSDTMTLWGGRFHTPYGYWNTAFHNGAQIQTSVLRPRFLAFGDRGGVLPAHMVGLWATGKTHTGEGRITYDAFAGNGPKITGISAPGGMDGAMNSNMAGDNNHNHMAGLNVGYEFSGDLDGLRLAAHGFQGIVDAYDGSAVLTDSIALNMLGGSAVYMTDDWEIMSEYYNFNNKDLSKTAPSAPGGINKSWAAYVQVGKEIGNLTPFVRVEKADLNQNDNYFGDQETARAYTREAAGFSYHLNEKASLKLELIRSNFKNDINRGSANLDSILAQYAIRF